MGVQDWYSSIKHYQRRRVLSLLVHENHIISAKNMCFYRITTPCIEGPHICSYRSIFHQDSCRTGEYDYCMRSFHLARLINDWLVYMHPVWLNQTKKNSSRCSDICAIWLFYYLKLIESGRLVGNKCIFLRSPGTSQKVFEDAWELTLQSVATVCCFLVFVYS